MDSVFKEQILSISSLDDAIIIINLLTEEKYLDDLTGLMITSIYGSR